MNDIWMLPAEYVVRGIHDEVLVKMKSNGAIVSGYIYYDSSSGKYKVATSPDFEFEDYGDYEVESWCYIPGEVY